MATCCCSNKVVVTHAYQVSSPYVVLLVSLKSEEVVIRKSSWGFLLLWSSWKWCNTYVHKVSPPCVLQLASLRREEVVLKIIAWGFFKQYVVVMETCNCHGNDIMVYIPSFISACYHWKEFEKWRNKFKEKYLRLFVTCIIVIMMLAIEHIMNTNFRSHSSYQWTTCV